jgi:flavorubredoxin
MNSIQHMYNIRKSRHCGGARMLRPSHAVVWLAHRSRPTRGFICWAETSVCQLSLFVTDAWRFASVAEARNAALKAFGLALREFDVSVTIVQPNEQATPTEGVFCGSHWDGNLDPFDTGE